MPKWKSAGSLWFNKIDTSIQVARVMTASVVNSITITNTGAQNPPVEIFVGKLRWEAIRILPELQPIRIVNA